MTTVLATTVKRSPGAPRGPEARGAGRPGPAAARRRPGDRRPQVADSIPPRDGPLFASLRSLRSELARRDGVPAYVVFPDSTLAEIAARRPRSLTALAGVRGVGPARLDRYGEQFLDAVRTHTA